VAHAADHFEKLRVFAEEMFSNKFAVVRFVGLVLAVDGFFHDAAQNAFFVASQKRIPVSAPDQLDNVPAAAPEIALELLDNFAIAAYRAIQTLQIAVDDKNQIVELFARSKADGAEGLGLIHFA